MKCPKCGAELPYPTFEKSNMGLWYRVCAIRTCTKCGNRVSKEI